MFYALTSQPVWVRSGGLAVGMLLALVVSWFSGYGADFREYAQASIAEGRRVTWPTRKETLQMTGVVLAFVAVLAIFLFIVDWALAKVLYGYVLHRG